MAGEEARERERKRESAPGGGENGEGGGAVHSGGGGVVAPASRACRPRGAVGLTRSRARGAAVSKRTGRRRGRGAGRPGLVSLAGPVGWRRPASEQPLLSFFLKLFFPKPFSKSI